MSIAEPFAIGLDPMGAVVVPVVTPAQPSAAEQAAPPKAIETLDRVALMGLPIDNVTKEEAVAAIMARLDDARPSIVCFVNADYANLAAADAEYRAAIQQADLVFADGVGMDIAARFAGHRLVDNVNGTDLFPLLCDSLDETGRRVYLLGGQPGVAASVGAWIQTYFPGVFICGWHDGHFEAADEGAVSAKIARAKPDLLLVGMGEPRQTFWTQRHLAATGARVAIGVGGLFDFYSGRIPRAPQWVRSLRCEWMYRLIQEPRRLWRRYLIGNVVFLTRMYRESKAKKAMQREMELSTDSQALPGN